MKLKIKAEKRIPIRLAYGFKGSQIVYRTIRTGKAYSVRVGNTIMIVQYGKIKVNDHSLDVYRIWRITRGKPKTGGMWQAIENNPVFTPTV